MRNFPTRSHFLASLAVILLALFPLLMPAQASGSAPDTTTAISPSAPATTPAATPATPVSFPVNVLHYEKLEEQNHITGVWDKICFRAKETPFNVIASLFFLLAIIHTFIAGKFSGLAHKLEHKYAQNSTDPEQPVQSFRVVLLHFLGEVEAVFGIWIIPLMIAMSIHFGFDSFRVYMEHREFTEPLFVVVIMIIAASRPVVAFAESIMKSAARLGKGTPAAWWLSVLTVGPILGSFITEPAAMTICAVLLAKRIYRLKPSAKLSYATLGLLFVNISIGGTLTHFAAPPVVMIASKWGWGLETMFFDFGWKAVTAIAISNTLYYLVFRKELLALGAANDSAQPSSDSGTGIHTPIPLWVTLTSLLFLAWTVYFNHHSIIFIGAFLFFLGFTIASARYQNPIAMRIPLMVGFFLAALVVHGGLQTWWLQPILSNLSSHMAMLSSTILTAFNDNAAITYLAGTVPDLSQTVKHAIVAGAVTGGGLTVIANAPNPAGQSILNKFFQGGINPLYLFLGAFVPTAISYLAFVFLYDLL